MALAARQAVEPFAERVCLGNAGTADDLYRFGYRISETGAIVAAIEIPAELLEEAISSNMALSCRLTPDGDLIPEFSFERGRTSSNGALILPIDQLIRATLTPQNLHMDEATIVSLTTMLQRLEASVNVVRDALARCTDRAKDQSFEN
ncbi:hypothetical protein ACVIW2_004508 [Bradyrhizobium huanghuaihaiense]|nr:MULTISPECIES: hypothetical protein [Bradyrhizobium]APO50215.1 hypothetical protein BD122_08251 [Bradyrhizobium diazoefficiens]KGJ66040.1 hypothetical protein BJA5080_02688 [Bradyrhizobium diazoefficiens SEMIA 5080]MBP1089574.1 hypothetical protein [Bradyrhizobium japonicum]MCD9297373.1 hypothetical protein [Bradyrhizobium diazoefficiens]MCD9814741.1 hypothetical protein [Bradyrhizobium diazoefficiens]